MFGMFGFLESTEQRKARLERERRWVEERLTRTVPWTPDIKWQPEMNLQASTYPVRRLFYLKATTVPYNVWSKPASGSYVSSPERQIPLCAYQAAARLGAR